MCRDGILGYMGYIAMLKWDTWDTLGYCDGIMRWDALGYIENAGRMRLDTAIHEIVG